MGRDRRPGPTALTQVPADWPVTVFDTIDSTNQAAKRAAREGALEPRWFRAREQTAGRGRQGRAWVSPVGNLYATALFALPGGYGDAVQVPFMAAIAVAEALETLAPGSEPRLKWPNDVRVDGRKLAGILIESGTRDGAVWVAAGIGLNVAGVPEAAGQAATSIADLRGDSLIDASMAMDMLAGRFGAHVSAMDEGFDRVRRLWLSRAEGLGETVRVRAGPGETHQIGVFEDMGPDGSLILRLPDGASRIIRAGDVDLVKRA